MLVVVAVAFVWLCSAMFVGTFTSSVPVTLTSDRSGLVMESGAKVEMRGVQVGRVSGVAGGPQPVSLKLELFSDQVKYIPANVQAQIRATNVFAAKYVDLIYPDNPSPQRISAGAVLRSRNVSTEINTVFQDLVDVLHQIDPPKLDAVLTAIADAVRGQGQRIGEAITDSDQALAAINPRMGTLQQDWRSIKGFSDAYSPAYQHILTILNSFSTTSATITHQAADLDALLLNAIGFSQAGINLLGPNQGNLVHAINTLEPTTSLLMKYNPEYTCTLVGANNLLTKYNFAQMLGGNGYSAVIDAGLQLGRDLYRYPDNLPIVAAKGGPGGKPGCGPLPDVSKDLPVKQLVTNTGWGTGIDIRPNPGIGNPCYMDLLPVTRGYPRPPSIRPCIPGPAPGPIPYPGAPPYGAPLYGPDGIPLYPGVPPPTPPAAEAAPPGLPPSP